MLQSTSTLASLQQELESLSQKEDDMLVLLQTEEEKLRAEIAAKKESLTLLQQKLPSYHVVNASVIHSL